VMTDVVDVKDVLWGRVIGLAVPPGVPDEHRAWLQELVRKATEDERYKERGDTLPGRVLRIRDHEEAARLAQSIHDFADPIVRELNLHYEQQ
jgi:tripartite-type tricarboxylate transporter receptor subunit TctC